MVTTSLDQDVFALDRRTQIEVRINGQVIGSGIGMGAGNVKSVDITFSLNQQVPTTTVTMTRIPEWVQRRHSVEIDIGVNGVLIRQFTGKVKKRRHTERGDTLDCVGATEKLLQPYRTLPLEFINVDAYDAVWAIIDQVGWTWDHPTAIDTELANFVLGTIQPASVDGSPYEMIYKIVDPFGFRVYESRIGALVIRPLLESPAPKGVYSFVVPLEGQTVPESSSSTTEFDDTNIDTDLPLGDFPANTRFAQGVQPVADGTTIDVGFYIRTVGAPTDSLQFMLHNDDGTGLPGTTLLGKSGFYNSQLLSTTYQLASMPIVASSPLVAGETYHVVVRRSGALDPVNYYEIGADSTGGYGGQGAFFNGSVWSSFGMDFSFEVNAESLAAARVLSISDDEDEDQVKKMVVVKGAVLSIADEEGNEQREQLRQPVLTQSNELVTGMPEFFSMDYNNDLIQEVADAVHVGQVKLDKYHRVILTVEIQTPFLPQIALGSTIVLNDPRITKLGGNWWVASYRHSISSSHMSTQMTLFGGDQSGTTGLVPPTAEYTVRSDRELMGGAFQVTATFDASTSYDPDGRIVDYHWTDNYPGGALDTHTATPKITRTYDPAVADNVIMTLVVMDDSGLESEPFQSGVLLDDTNETAYVPNIVAALGNTVTATFDGAQSWVDLATPSGIAKVSAITYDPANPNSPVVLLFGTSNGRIYRSVDQLGTLQLVYTDASSQEIVAIVPNLTSRQTLWAATTDKVLISHDYGETWLIYTNFALSANWFKHGAGHVNDGPTDPRPIRGLLLSDPSVARTWIYGGRGDVVESWFGTNYWWDGPASWWSEVAQGAGVGATPRSSSQYVVDAVVSHGSSGDLGLLFASSGSPPSNPYIYSESFVPIGSANWQNGGGAMVGANENGVAVKSNNLQQGEFLLLLENRTSYVSGDGLAFWPIPDVLPGTASNDPTGLVNLTAWQDIYLAPTEEGIAKTVDFARTWTFIRPQGANTWPAGAIGYDLNIEYRPPQPFQLYAFVYDDVAGKTASLTRLTGPWRKASEDAGAAYPYAKFGEFAGLNRVFRTRGNTLVPFEGADWNTLQYSDDLFATWNNIAAVAGCSDVTRAANGDLYAIGTGGDAQPHRIYRSIDDGDTWTEVKNDATISGGAYTRYRSIEADLTDPDRIIVAGWQEGTGNQQVLLICSDATLGVLSNWNRVTPTMTTPAATTNMLLMLTSSKILLAYESSTSAELIVDSSTAGVTWTNSLRRASAGNEPPRGFVRAGSILYLAHSATGGLLRSPDGGQSWESYPDISQQTSIRTLSWDNINNILYVGAGSFAYQRQATDLVAAWTDITAGIAAATGFAVNKIAAGGINSNKG